MNTAAVEAQVKAALREVVRGFDPEKLDPERNFRDQFDFDSVDFLNFALVLQKKLGASIRETDYPRLSSLRGCLAHFGASEPR
jgi:acyl carrier protein